MFSIIWPWPLQEPTKLTPPSPKRQLHLTIFLSLSKISDEVGGTKTEGWTLWSFITHGTSSPRALESLSSLSLTHMHTDFSHASFVYQACDIIDKLLAKSAEDRYQSADGLLADLHSCMHGLCSPDRNRVLMNFEAGKVDVLSRFSVPTKLYGREKEIAMLNGSFHRAVLRGPEVPLLKLM